MNNTDKLAHIAINKSLLKEFRNSENERIVYLKDGDEFQIQVFNPYSYVIGVSFTFNSNNNDNSRLLILKPGERVWLDRYLDDNKKFLFSTYEVNASKEVKKAIEKNGLLNIYFYREKEYNNLYFYDNHSITVTQPKPIEITWTGDSPNWYYDNTVTCYNNNLVDACTTELSASTVNSATWASASIDANGNYKYSDSYGNHYTDSARTLTAAEAKPIKNGLNSCVNKTNFNKSIETGRINKGNYSNQKFKNYYGEFENWYFKKETIKLLPQSQKQINTNDLKKKYCHNCGKKIKSDFKFCPNSGAKQ